jgi:type VI secretion system protein ImpL
MVQGFVAPAAKAGGEARISSASGAVSSLYAQTIGPACASVTEGRYPFMTASQNNAPVADLLRVFGLNGQVDSFVNTRLRPLMETSGPVWRWRLDDPVAASLDPTSAGEFQRAAELRDLLLSGVAVRVEATGFGGTVTAAELSAGGANYRFEAGQPGQRQIQWTPSSLPEARVALFAGTAMLKEYAFDGPWATFRLFDAARKENAGPTAFKATFGEGASSVTFRVTLPGEKNPFSRGGIWSFRCPPRL